MSSQEPVGTLVTWKAVWGKAEFRLGARFKADLFRRCTFFLSRGERREASTNAKQVGRLQELIFWEAQSDG